MTLSHSQSRRVIESRDSITCHNVTSTNRSEVMGLPFQNIGAWADIAFGEGEN